MADTTVQGPPQQDPEDLGVPVKSKSYTGANGAAWAAGNDLKIEPPCRAVRCAGAGNLHVMYPDQSQDTIPSVVAGETIQGQFVRIYADSTIATGITIQW